MATATEAPQPTTADEMLEAQVLQNEERLEGLLELARMKGSGEGPRFPTTLKNPRTGEEFTIKDRTFEEKTNIATDAAAKRASEYEGETYRYAKVRLNMANEVEALDLIRGLNPGDREIYLKAEEDGLNRDVIFEVFGRPAPTRDKEEN